MAKLSRLVRADGFAFVIEHVIFYCFFCLLCHELVPFDSLACRPSSFTSDRFACFVELVPTDCCGCFTESVCLLLGLPTELVPSDWLAY